MRHQYKEIRDETMFKVPIEILSIGDMFMFANLACLHI